MLLLGVLVLGACSRSENSGAENERTGGETAPSVDIDAATLANLSPGDTTPESQLPASSVPGIPGWIGLGTREVVLKVRGSAPTTAPAVGIFPYDAAWNRVGRATSLVAIAPEGMPIIYPNGFTARDTRGNEIILGIRSVANVITPGWIIPTSQFPAVHLVPIQDSISSDLNSRVWTAGAARIVLRRTSPVSGELIAELNGLSATRKKGVKADSALDLRSSGGALPEFWGAFRFDAANALVMLFREGDSCVAVHVVVFRPSGIEWIEEPHYNGNCAR